jgi:glucosamine-6-phosphate deaminase
MRWELCEGPAALNKRAAELLLEALSANVPAVLGLSAAPGLQGLYEEVAERCRSETPELQQVRAFPLAETVGLPATHPDSASATLRRQLFEPLGLPAANVYVPDATGERLLSRQPELGLEEALMLECQAYEDALAAAGSLTLTVLELEADGSIAGNRPGASPTSRTRVVEPVSGGLRQLTVGLATLLEADAIVLLASGASKAAAVARLVRAEPAPEDFPVAVLQGHPDVTLLIDRDAASGVSLLSQVYPQS